MPAGDNVLGDTERLGLRWTPSQQPAPRQ